jgi:hypothetical protein
VHDDHGRQKKGVTATHACLTNHQAVRTHDDALQIERWMLLHK